MKRRSKTAVVLAAILAALLMLAIVLPVFSAGANAAWYDIYGPGVPDLNDLKYKPHQGLYHENTYDEYKAADSSSLQGIPVIYDIGMELSKDGNIKLVSNVRLRHELTYCWQAWSDKGTATPTDDAWVNIAEAGGATLRPADYMQNGPQMIRLLLTHSSYGTAVSIPIILTLTDGVGENEGFTGGMAALVKSAKEHGYVSGAHATQSGIARADFADLSE